MFLEVKYTTNRIFMLQNIIGSNDYIMSQFYIQKICILRSPNTPSKKKLGGNKFTYKTSIEVNYGSRAAPCSVQFTSMITTKQLLIYHFTKPNCRADIRIHWSTYFVIYFDVDLTIYFDFKLVSKQTIRSVNLILICFSFEGT